MRELLAFVWLNLQTMEIESPIYSDAELQILLYELLREEDAESFDLTDNQDAIPVTLDGPDYGAKFIELVDMQERMAIGMEMIQAETQRRNRIYNYKKKSQEDWVNFRDARDKVRHYWKHWFRLKDECMEIIGQDTFLWAWYFKHIEEPITPYLAISDSTSLDELNDLLYPDTWGAYGDSHVAEMAEYYRD